MAFDFPLPGVPTLGSQLDQAKAQAPLGTAWVRDYLKNTYKVPEEAIGWDANNNQVTLNNNPFAIPGLTMADGKSWADPKSIDTSFNQMFPGGYQAPTQPGDQYRDERQGLVNQMQDLTNKGYTPPIADSEFVDIYNQMKGISNQQYDPNADPGLKQAQDQAMLAVQNRMAGSGMLFGDTTKAMMAQEAQKLIPEYTKMFYMNQERQLNNMLNTGNFGRDINADSYKRYTDNISNIVNMYDMYDKFDTQDFNMFKENMQLMQNEIDNQFNERELKLREEDKSYQRARDRVEDLGYVDNESSVILGMEVGTLSKTARERLEGIEDFILQEEIKLKNEKTIIAEQTAKTLKTMAAKEKEADPFSAATEDQKFWYAEIQKQLYGSDGSSKYVDSALMKLTQNEAGFRQLLGNDLYEYMYSKGQQLASKIPEYKESTEASMKSTDYKTNPEFADEVSWINSNLNTAKAEIKKNSQELIATYGTDGYNYLLKLTQ
jgi:hypothetical protein